MAIAQSNYTLSGYITDAENGESLIGATILDARTGKGTISNAFGFYSLTLPSDSVDLHVSYVGYVSLAYRLNLVVNQSLNFQLQPGSLLQEVIVTADELIEQAPQMSTIDVGIDKIKALPALMGEQDVLGDACSLLLGTHARSHIEIY